MSTDNQRAQKVLEKWGMEDVDTVNEEDFKKVADNFARIQVKNKFLKKTAIVGVIFIFAFLGLMLGSVILGVDISKDFKVRNEALVQKGNSSNVLQTGEIFYSVNLGLTTPLSTIKGIKHLKFNTKEFGTLQFSVVSFYFIYGRNLTFYGVNHVANVLGDGSVEVYPIKNANGAKRIDESQVKRTSSGSVSATGTSQTTNSGVVMISDCQGLLNMQSNGKYSLVNNIECTLSQPLLPNGFSGILNGNGHSITVHMNTNGPAALFSSVSGKIANVLLRGDISGVQNCAGFAVSAYTGSFFLSNGMYASITCRNDPAVSDYQTVGGYAALLRNPTGSNQKVSFMFSVSQGHLSATVNDINIVSYTGSFYGRTGIQESLKTKFSFTYAASRLEKYGNNSHVNSFGFKYSFPHTSRSPVLKRDVYVPEDCYNYDELNPDYINMCVEWFVTYYYENQDCCSTFYSCPYVQCNRYSQVCMDCRVTGYGKKDEVVSEHPEIVPTVHTICEGF